MLRHLRLDWPLLGKELIEQAARKQMYIIRVTYALVLFGAFCFYYVRHLAEEPVQAFGSGLGPFHFLVSTLFVTIFLFMPPLMAGAIAQEKERDTLGLLFLTDLTPWEFILQKYIGRLIPMLTLLFLSLPLLAVAYSLGGVSADMLVSGAESLFFTCLVVGALALECSAHQATAFQALVRCWGLCLVFVTCCWIEPTRFWYRLLLLAPTYGAMPIPGNLIVPVFFTPVSYLVLTYFFLLRAKQILEARAFVQPRNPFRQQFKHLDQYWKDIRKLTRAMLRKHDQEAYALAKQVVRSQVGWDDEGWSLGSFLFARMQVPNLLAFAIIFGFIIFIILFFGALLDPKSTPFFLIIGAFWLLALLTIPILSTNAVASERTNERLGAILTTPLTGVEILDEWLAPVRRWTRFLVRPLVVLFVMQALVKFKTHGAGPARWNNSALYLAISLLTVWIYPRLVQWFCLWIGLRIRNQIRALMTAFLLVVAWCALPFFLSSYLGQTGLLPPDWTGVLNFISPVYAIGGAEAFGDPKSDITPAWDLAVPFIAHFAVAAVLLWRIRHVCLARADYYLGRI